MSQIGRCPHCRELVLDGAHEVVKRNILKMDMLLVICPSMTDPGMFYLITNRPAQPGTPPYSMEAQYIYVSNKLV